MADVQGDQPLKYTITHYRKPEHTHEAFIKWIVEKHIPLAIPVLKKHGATGYSLVSASINNTVLFLPSNVFYSSSPRLQLITH